MKYLFKDWDKIKKRLNNKSVALFLDYDGTISPLADKPDRASTPDETRRLLGDLLKIPENRLAVISGRALRDIKKRVGIDRIIYVGNHGLEIEGPKIKFTSPVFMGYKRLLRSIRNDLGNRLVNINGILIEDKGISLSIHYRLVEESQLAHVKTVLHEATIVHVVRNKIRVRLGKKVFEIRPALEWDKGKAVLWLLARWKFGLSGREIVPIYLGDDVSDEDAFRVLEKQGITVFIGTPKRSRAEYYLKDSTEVKDFLRRFEEFCG
jgi:trehalose-phosphatase